MKGWGAEAFPPREGSPGPGSYHLPGLFVRRVQVGEPVFMLCLQARGGAWLSLCPKAEGFLGDCPSISLRIFLEEL